jgi:hypothetical protein
MKETGEYRKCKYVLKVTGKYFLEDIENKLSNAETDADNSTCLFLQTYRDLKEKFQHSEYFGMCKNQFEEFIEKNEYAKNAIHDDYILENHLFNYSELHKYTTIGTFTNDVKQADGAIMKLL